MKKQFFAAICSLTMLTGAAGFVPALNLTADSDAITAEAYDEEDVLAWETIQNVRYAVGYANDINSMAGYKIIAAFNDNFTTVDITIPTTVGGYPISQIGNQIFKNSNRIRTVTIPSCINQIGNDFLNNCSSVQNVNFTSTIYNFGDNCFRNATNLRTLNVPSGTLYVGDYFCYHATSLQSITFGNALDYIGSNCCEGCTSLQTASLGTGLEYIGDYAFYGCNHMTNFSCPSTHLGEWTPNLSQIGYGILWANSWADNWNATHTDLVMGSGTFLYRYNGNPGTNASITTYKNTIKYVYDYAFGADAWTHGSKIKTLDLRSAERIGTNAFKKLSQATVILSRSKMIAAYGSNYLTYLKAQSHTNTKFSFVS